MYALLYSIILFFILIFITLYLVRQIVNTQVIEKKIKKLQKKKKPEDLYMLGQLYLQKKLFNRAIIVFREALKTWNSNDKIGIASLMNMIGFTYFKLKKYRFAIYFYKVAIQIAPDYLIALKNLAFVYESINLFQEASNHYRTCLLLEPDNKFFSSRIKMLDRQLFLKSTTR